MWSVSPFNFQAMHYKESLFCFSWLKMRPRYWVECISSLFSCFQMWPSLPADIRIPSCECSNVMFWRGLLSLQEHLHYSLPPLFCFIFLHGTYDYGISYSVHLFICLPTLKCELHEHRDLVSSAYCPTPALGKVSGNVCKNEDFSDRFCKSLSIIFLFSSVHFL